MDELMDNNRTERTLQWKIIDIDVDNNRVVQQALVLFTALFDRQCTQNIRIENVSEVYWMNIFF